MSLLQKEVPYFARKTGNGSGLQQRFTHGLGTGPNSGPISFSWARAEVTRIRVNNHTRRSIQAADFMRCWKIVSELHVCGAGRLYPGSMSAVLEDCIRAPCRVNRFCAAPVGLGHSSWRKRRGEKRRRGGGGEERRGSLIYNVPE